jgi:hypothetical protein
MSEALLCGVWLLGEIMWLDNWLVVAARGQKHVLRIEDRSTNRHRSLASLTYEYPFGTREEANIRD